VNSSTATAFRQWATQRLREYIVKGFVLDDERLKNPDLPFDYFEELARRIQDIRTSEKRFYRKITDIYALSVDYDPTSEISIDFFKTVQNKIHFGITKQTAAEIVVSRVNSKKPNMSLTSWRGTVPRKDDVAIAKNYLNENELLALNNLVEQYLIFAEGQAMRRIPMKMKDWITKLDGFLEPVQNLYLRMASYKALLRFRCSPYVQIRLRCGSRRALYLTHRSEILNRLLQLNDRDILKNAGNISHELAREIAEQEYKKFNQNRLRTEDEFEKISGVIEQNKKRIKSQKTKT